VVTYTIVPEIESESEIETFTSIATTWKSYWSIS